jgi:hypothetical protein
MSDDGLPLGGATGARRVGNEVLRPTGPWTPAVHLLMRHARANGILEAPDVLGLDQSGRYERLGWIPGDDRGVDLGADEDLHAVGRLVRRVHDALESFAAPPEASWRLRSPGPRFIHGDISPWNVVWRQGQVVGLLDWDQAGPGRDLEDIAYAAWVWVPLECPDDIPGHWRVDDPSLDGQRRRLVRLTDSYGLTREERLRFLSEVAYVQATTGGRVAVGASQGDEGMSRIWWGGQRVGAFGSAMKWLATNWVAFEEALNHP